MSAAEPPLRAAIIPVTPLQQNCTLLWCTKTMRGAFVDSGGDLPRLKAAAEQAGVTIEKILLTHGHIDHCGSAGIFAEELGVPIEGPHEDDRFWIDRLAEDGTKYGITGRAFEPSRWLADSGQVTVGELTFDVRHCPGHTPGHIVFHHPDSNFALVGDVLFKGSVGRWDFPKGDQQQLIRSTTERLWPMGDETAFVPGHGPMSTFGHERATNPFVSESEIQSGHRRVRVRREAVHRQSSQPVAHYGGGELLRPKPNLQGRLQNERSAKAGILVRTFVQARGGQGNIDTCSILRNPSAVDVAIPSRPTLATLSLSAIGAAVRDDRPPPRGHTLTR